MLLVVVYEIRIYVKNL